MEVDASGQLRRDELKQAVAAAALPEITEGMVLGLGSGSTLACFARALAEYARTTDLHLEMVPTSHQIRLLAFQLGLSVRDPMCLEHIDLTVDGADEIDTVGNLLKGGGGAHVLEKVIAARSQRCLILADESKLVSHLGEKHPVPIEVLSAALPFVMERLQAMGGRPTVRLSTTKAGPTISDLGNLIVDCDFGPIDNLPALDQRLNNLPGIIDHGLFLGMADEILIARSSPAGIQIDRLCFQRDNVLM